MISIQSGAGVASKPFGGLSASKGFVSCVVFASMVIAAIAVSSAPAMAQAFVGKTSECRATESGESSWGYGVGTLEPNELGFNVQSGQQINVRISEGAGTVRIFSGTDVTQLLAESATGSLTYIVPAAGVYVIGATITATGPFGNATGFVTCTTAVAPPAITSANTAQAQQSARSGAAQQSLASQSGAVQSALSTNIGARFGGGGVTASSRSVFVSTQGMDRGASQFERPELNAWISVEARRMSGVATGQSRSVTLGMDRFLTSDLLLGGFVSLSDSRSTTGANRNDIRAPMLGFYGAQRMELGFLSAYLGYGRPDYRTSNGNFTATRQLLGLTYEGDLAMNALRVMPSVGLSGTREALPASGALAADRIETMQARIGLRLEPAARYENGLLPYLSLAAEHGRQSSRTTVESHFTKPRLGLGFDWQTGAGLLRLDLDRGYLSSATRDTGLRLSYDWSF